ncbi:MAG TPA: UDP-N-acetylmuramyl-tripeptide synthetase [Candidatus Paceibacterota bacterium]|nr:UDP-N-acetylmuramyl-tripeptide synthetase [Candidatus Paceibacterota bacterium]
MEAILRKIKGVIPKQTFKKLQPWYHYFMALTGAIYYGFPSRRIGVILITGTKGKSSTVEIMSSILEAAGKKTALTNTIRFKIGDSSERNMFKMTTPGRFFMQRFLSRAVVSGCKWAVIEMSSEAAVQFRHKFLNPNAVIFLNLAPEHIESHGGYENYVNAKLSIAKELQRTSKKKRAIVVNADDVEHEKFLKMSTADRKLFSMKDAEPWRIHEHGILFSWKNARVTSQLLGAFNIMNCLAAAACAESLGIPDAAIREGIERMGRVAGRAEKIEFGQGFDAVIDYAHTPDSLTKLYEAFSQSKRIGVLGNTGGGRDTWKRPEMARIAALHCHHIFLTNEDPYDEDPMQIITDMASAIPRAPLTIEIDRRTAIKQALSMAREIVVANPGEKVSVLISGKGTDPYIMGKNGSKQVWSDRTVTEEELRHLLAVEAAEAAVTEERINA